MKKYLRFQIVAFAIVVFFPSCAGEEIVSDVENPSPNVTSKLIIDTVNGTDIILIGNPASDFIVSFKLELSNGVVPDLELVNGRLPIIMKDEKDNLYDIFGRIVEGDDEGVHLLPILSYQSYWFAIAAFFPGVEIYGRGEEEVDVNLQTDPNWSVPISNIFVGTGFDAIPSIDEPKLVLINNDGPNIDESMIPERNDKVVGIMEGGVPIAYPHDILNWHEIVNQIVGDYSITISFCPLTGTSIGWRSEEGSFGVSGLLYNSNLIAYDRETESLWSQMLGSSIYGNLKDHELPILSVTETKWSTWSAMYPDTRLLSYETGFARDYDATPYTGYIENDDLLYYPLDYEDDRLPTKDRVHAVIINNDAKVYTFGDFD